MKGPGFASMPAFRRRCWTTPEEAKVMVPGDFGTWSRDMELRVSCEEEVMIGPGEVA